MDKKHQNPEVRFKGFTDNWEEKLLADEVVFFSGLTYSPINVVRNGGTLVLRSSNVKNSQIVLTDNVFVDSEVVNCENVIVGDIIIVVRNGSRNLIGKHALIKENMPNTVIGAFMTGIHSKQSNFINSLLDTNQFEKEIEKNLGATINQITTGALKKMTFWFPKQHEQKHIGTFFQNIDNLTTLHQKKYDKLVILKKAMLVKMFPKKGSLKPEIRFKGFTEDWVEKELRELALISTGYPFDSNIFSEEGEYLVVTNGNIQNDISTVDNSKGNRIKVADVIIHYVLDINDILVTMDGTVGRTGKVINNKQVLAQRVGRLKAIFDLEFLYQFLNTGEFFNEMKIKSHGGTIKHISLTEIGDYKNLVPNSEFEQQKIGSYFENLDNQIELHKIQLEKLNNIKKACFSKMFVAQD
jgi:type I restriction enzyme S subunit